MFQKRIEQLLGEELLAAGVRVYLDDILIVSRTKDEHLILLDKVLRKLDSSGFKVKREKCTFLARNIEFLG